MTPEDVYQRVVKVIEDCGVNPDSTPITADVSLWNDLGFDSLDASELLMNLEDEFGCTLPDEILNKPDLTVKALAEAVETLVL